jgi:hypothetical protein
LKTLGYYDEITNKANELISLATTTSQTNCLCSDIKTQLEMNPKSDSQTYINKYKYILSGVNFNII